MSLSTGIILMWSIDNGERSMSEDAGAKSANRIKRPARADATPVLKEFVVARAREFGYEEGRVLEIGAALVETVDNILHFACADGTREISVRCTEHEMGMLVIDIRDTGRPFNMLVASSFPSTADFVEPGERLSTVRMKKAFKNIEYRRDGEQAVNILLCVVPK
jgi:anti-sigma regulatory factor (Ser/Thr protein kinase)